MAKLKVEKSAGTKPGRHAALKTALTAHPKASGRQPEEKSKAKGPATARPRETLPPAAGESTVAANLAAKMSLPHPPELRKDADPAEPRATPNVELAEKIKK